LTHSDAHYPSSKQGERQRNEEVDVIRGLALFGICVVNIPFLAMPINKVLERQAGLDGVVQFLVEWLFQGKFFLLFSFLFGWGLALQLNGRSTGANPKRRFVRRLSALLLIGVFHAVFVFFGDIIILYSLLGLPLLLISDIDAAKLIRIAKAVTTGAFALLVLLGFGLSDFDATNELGRNSSGYLGSFADSVVARINDLPTTLSFNLFCCGLAAAKAGFFERGNAIYELLRKRFWTLLIVGSAGNLLFASGFGGLVENPILRALFFASIAFFGPCLSCVYLIAAVEIARRSRLKKGLTAAGQMSLTIYIFEGALAGVLFNGYGFGLYGKFGAVGCLLVAISVYALTHLFAQIWLGFFKLGPLEKMLRIMTNGKNRK